MKQESDDETGKKGALTTNVMYEHLHCGRQQAEFRVLQIFSKVWIYGAKYWEQCMTCSLTENNKLNSSNRCAS